MRDTALPSGSPHGNDALLRRLGPCVLPKRDAAWSMRRYISVLGKSLGAVRQCYAVLLLDVHRPHIDQSILTHARADDRCDTHLFSKFKSALDYEDWWVSDHL